MNIDRIFRLFSFVLLTSLATSQCLYADISIDGYTDATNDRFTNSDQFIAGGFDLSGVGRAEGLGWATLISPNVAVTAFHYLPTTDIYFYPGNDSSQSPVIRNVVEVQRVNGTDIALLKLNQNVPNNIAIYDFATEDLSVPNAEPNTLYSAGSYQDVNAYLVGISEAEGEFNPTLQAVGRNVINGFGENIAGSTDILYMDFVRDSQLYEAFFRGGDSGAPLFVDAGNGNVELLGVNFGVYQEQDTRRLLGSGSTYLGNSADVISSFVSAQAVSTSAVPEPSANVLMVIVFAAFNLRRRRK